MSAEDFTRFDSLKLFLHQIYEFRKGVRNLVLCTMCPSCADILRKRLDSLGIAHLTQPVSDKKLNLYFGNENCLNAVKTFVHKPLNKLTPEEDFILGTMLGYDIRQQCERYCKRRECTADLSARSAC